jgi:glycosyl hydrolase family 113
MLQFRRLLLLGLILFVACTNSGNIDSSGIQNKVLGISFVAANERVTKEDISPIKELGASWVSLMPYGFVRKTDHVVHYNSQWQWWGETDSGLEETVKLAKENGLQVMLKPQVWFRHGEYTGNYVPPDSVKIEFEKSFAEFVLHYAQLSQKVGADLYCIGTEWHKFIDNDPIYWIQLIEKVKKVYTGKLTYAANWDEYMTVPFWRELDFIGVNAYFPLSDKKYPNMDDLQTGWQPWVAELKSLAENEGKPIVFTEYGYRSTVKNASKPWESYTKPDVSLENQTVAYRALYNEFWHQPWFAGGFAWKWFHNHDERGGEGHTGFSPQNKPVEEVIKATYSNHVK